MPCIVTSQAHVILDSEANYLKSSSSLQRELKHAVFETRTQPEENILRAKAVLSPRFLYYSSIMEKINLVK